MRYADHTRNTSERLKTLAHKNRFRDAAKLVRFGAADRVLDYGCGDGALFDRLDRFVDPAQLCGFDPYMDEIERRDIKVYKRADELVADHEGSFDTIYCLEVCEHLDPPRLAELFANIRRLGRAGGTVIFGVPLETGVSGLAKNLYRAVHGRRQGATIGKSLRSLFSLTIERVVRDPGWIGSHVGFDAWAFAATLASEGFAIERSAFLPWPWLRGLLNNELYLITRLARSEGQAKPQSAIRLAAYD